jgi:hypothetical protein
MYLACLYLYPSDLLCFYVCMYVCMYVYIHVYSYVKVTPLTTCSEWIQVTQIHAHTNEYGVYFSSMLQHQSRHSSNHVATDVHCQGRKIKILENSNRFVYWNISELPLTIHIKPLNFFYRKVWNSFTVLRNVYHLYLKQRTAC